MAALATDEEGRSEKIGQQEVKSNEIGGQEGKVKKKKGKVMGTRYIGKGRNPPRPRIDPNGPGPAYWAKCKTFTDAAAVKGLRFYNAKNPLSQFELVLPISSLPVASTKGSFEIHANFFAKAINSHSPAILFFSHLMGVDFDMKPSSKDVVLNCVPLSYPTYSLNDLPDTMPPMYHPLDVVCSSCLTIRYACESEDER